MVGPPLQYVSAYDVLVMCVCVVGPMEVLLNWIL